MGNNRLKYDLNMKQIRWLEFVQDYDFVINYHPSKGNVVIDNLSRKTQTKLGMFFLKRKNSFRT